MGQRYIPVHFNGDVAATQLAYTKATNDQVAHDKWKRDLRIGDPVQVKDDHPKADIAGAVGTIVEFSFTSGDKFAVVKFRAQQVGIALKWLIPPRLPEAPPKFASQEEADRWLEDTARELGLKTEADVPQFATQAEADEWLEEQQRLKSGEPYVPRSWLGNEVPVYDQDGRLIGMSVGPGKYSIPAFPKVGIEGQRPQMYIYDEAAEYGT